MIEIRKNPDPNLRREAFLFIDGDIVEEAYIRVSSKEPSYFDATTKDYSSSHKIAIHKFSEFPFAPAQLFLNYYPANIKHLNKPSGLFISRQYERKPDGSGYEDINEFLVYLDIGGGALSEWQESYTFADYAFEMYKLLKTRKDIYEIRLSSLGDRTINIEYDEYNNIIGEVDPENIDKRKIHSMELVFPYSSLELTPAEELARISKIIQEVDKEVLRLLPKDSSKTLPKAEIRKTVTPEQEEYQLFINGSVIEDAKVHQYGQPKSKGVFWGISFKDYQAMQSLEDLRFSDIPEGVAWIDIELSPSITSLSGLITSSESMWVHAPDKFNLHELSEIFTPFSNAYKNVFMFFIDISKWVGQCSPKEYVDEVEAAFSDNDDVYVHFQEYEEFGFIIAFRITSVEQRIIDGVMLHTFTIRNLLDKLANKLASPENPRSIVTSFNFPKEVAVYCEQYLQYFIQFLRDLGVEATSELKHKAGEVLFTVTPIDEREALDKIQEALNIYLELPKSPISNDMENEIEVQRLEMTVHRLQGDLKLAAAELKANNTTIEGQQLIIELQKRLLSGEIMTKALKDVAPKPEDDEPILGGTVTLSTIGKGIKFNLAEIYRKLKGEFKRSK